MTTTQMSWRVIAGSAALATAAVGTVMAPGAHGATVHPTSISIRTAHQRIAPGASDQIRGNLHIKGVNNVHGRIVTLQAEPTGATTFTAVGNAAANANGGITLTVTPAVTTKYRWHYAGSSNSRARNSGVVRVVVRVPNGGGGTPTRQPTSLSIRAAHRVVDATGHDVVRGTLLSKHKDLDGRTVELLSKTAPATTFSVAGSQTTDSNGRVAFDVTPASATTYELSFLGTTAYRPSHSGVVRVGVRPSISISASPKRVDPGTATAISGAATYQGTPLAGATVDLLGKPVKGKHAFTKVGTGVTAADGTVTISVIPTQDSIYRLAVEKTGTQPAASSRAIVVRLKTSDRLLIAGKHTKAGYVVSGILRGGGKALAHQSVVLMAAAPGTTTFAPVATGQTAKNGAVKFIETEAAGTTYRLDYAGNNNYAAASSGTVVD